MLFMRLYIFVSSDEVRQLKKAREELEKDTEQWKTEQTKEQEEERLQHKYALAVMCC